jgi:hypothetical protein
VNEPARLERGDKPLARTELRRTAWLRSRPVLSPDAPVKPMRRRDTGPSMKVRLQVYKRDGYTCQCGCGISVIGKPHSVGHRKRRSQQGSNEMTNLLTFLGWGNGLTGDEDHRRRIDMRVNPDDEARGLTVRSGQDPALVPVITQTPSGPAPMWLTADGRKTDEAPRRASLG